MALRRQHAELFTAGRYQPVQVTGGDAGDIVAFARVKERDALIVVAATRFGRVTDGGRHWPAPRAWEASLVLKDYTEPRRMLDPRGENPGAEVARLFGALPVAILHAKYAARATKSAPARALEAQTM
jgi:(1->4)-alpha-D-glucan 1-alpha-D-glucosylmutase